MTAGLLALLASPWWGLLAAGLLAGVLATLAPRRCHGQLRGITRAAGGVDWWWREGPDRAWRPVGLRCDYLGPWLIGLRVEGRRLWLWPDSSDAASLRQLRRALLPLP